VNQSGEKDPQKIPEKIDKSPVKRGFAAMNRCGDFWGYYFEKLGVFL